MQIEQVNQHICLDNSNIPPEFVNHTISLVGIKNEPYSIIQLYEEGLSKREEDVLYHSPIEVAVYEKKTKTEHFLIPLFKIGKEKDSFVYSYPLNPSSKVDELFVDKWIAHRLIAFMRLDVNDHAKIVYRHLRVCSIPDDIHNYLSRYFLQAREQQETWQTPFYDWLGQLAEGDLITKWNQATYLGNLGDYCEKNE
ncbi:hypothetical protein ACERJO_17670 [Halalkalibacter sp. AB-rgal2]|uniref:hypothetical protein n=1 Tax=Halalkalibacter sp. AB-rgal2 TaxID=3242695 RepID=UPI00359DAB52